MKVLETTEEKTERWGGYTMAWKRTGQDRMEWDDGKARRDKTGWGGTGRGVW